MTTLQRIEERRVALKDLEGEIAFLEMLPPDLPVEHAFRLHGAWHVSLKGGSLPDLLTALPALPVCLQEDGWGRLETRIASPDELTLPHCQQVYPVWSSGETVQWFTRVGPQGLQVKVSAKQVPMQVPSGYERKCSSQGVWTLQRRAPALREDQGPQEAFNAAWEAFFAVEGYTEPQRMFARVFRLLSSRNVELKPADLPVSHASTMELAGQTLEVLRSGPAPQETVPDGSPLYALPRVGAFWSRFTEAQATRLLQFSNASRCDLESQDAQFVRKALADAKACAERFIQEQVSSQRNRPKADVLEFVIQDALGLAITVASRDSVTRGLGDRIRHSYWLHLRRYNEDLSVELPATYDPKGFDWNFPTFMTVPAGRARRPD